MSNYINQALAVVASKYNVVTKIYEPGERKDIGCKIQAERAREMASKQSSSRAGKEYQYDLLAHAEAIEAFRKSGGKLD